MHEVHTAACFSFGSLLRVIDLAVSLTASASASRSFINRKVFQVLNVPGYDINGYSLEGLCHNQLTQDTVICDTLTDTIS